MVTAIVVAVLVVFLAVVGGLALSARSKHPDAVGGTLGDFLEVVDGPGRLTWLSWSMIGITREGEITHGGHPASDRVRVKRSAFCGLVPLGAVERPLIDYYRVKVETAIGEDTDRTRVTYNRTTGGVRMDHPETVVHYTVILVPRRGYELTLFVFVEDWRRTKGESVVGRFRATLEKIIGVPGETRLAPARQAPDHQGRRMVCPNCRGSFDLGVKQCPKCSVALFEG